jgi:hypothetical protein
VPDTRDLELKNRTPRHLVPSVTREGRDPYPRPGAWGDGRSNRVVPFVKKTGRRPMVMDLCRRTGVCSQSKMEQIAP